MKKGDILKIGIIGLIIVVVLTSGCISSSTVKTFSNGVISFDYPGDFKNVTYSSAINASTSPMQRIGAFENGYDLTILVGRNVTENSPTEFRDWIISRNKNRSNGEISSVTTETNPNGVVVERISYKHPGSPFGIMIMYDDMYFEKNGTMYGISVYGPDILKQEIDNTAKTIFQSIK